MALAADGPSRCAKDDEDRADDQQGTTMPQQGWGYSLRRALLRAVPAEVAAGSEVRKVRALVTDQRR
jgi:hypothetical protein